MRIRRYLQDMAGVEDPPCKIALGMALGLFVGMLPIMGIQMIAVLPFVILLGGNKAAALAGVWISNPLTVVPIYYVDYRVGLLLLDMSPLSWARFKQLVTDLSLVKLMTLGKALLTPLFAGGFVIALVSGLLGYLVTYQVAIRSRKNKARQHASVETIE